MNNKGFNWFFPIAIIALILLFVPNLMGESNAKTIDEDGFFREMQAGKVQRVVIDKQAQKADVFLTQAAKSATVKKEDKSSPFSGLSMSPKADFTLKYGDLRLFLEKFDALKQQNPALQTSKDYAEGESPLMGFLLQAIV